MSPVLPSPPELHTSPELRQVEPWLSVVSHTDPRYGGLSTAVPQSEVEISALGDFAVSLAAFCAAGEEYRPAGFEGEALSFWPASRGLWVRSPSLRRRFAERIRSVAGVHIHGLWEASTAVAAQSALSLGKPYVISAHGMLEPWALANKRWKKTVYAALLERRLVAQATCLHALTAAEAAQYRAFGARNPIAVVPNAVQIPGTISPEGFFQRYPSLRTRRLLLYLGRLHPKKGLDLLSAAWARLAAANRDWHLVLAGPDSEGTEAQVRAALSRPEMEDSFTFTGMLSAEAKWSAYAASEAFVLPSYSEGLSMGVLEALGAGLPVLITRHCNLPEAAASGAGWQTEANLTSLTFALEELFASSREENKARGTLGHDLVTSRYNPRVVAERMSEIYKYASHGILPSKTEILTV